ncbi:MAG: EAL domain-containing protein [Treponema sp.]|nr:EAL domain-containing protein [Treponema sp.]
MDLLENGSVERLRRALEYETQFRNALVSDAVAFFDANISKNVIEGDFFYRISENDFVSIPDFLGISTPCSFTKFIELWAQNMIPDRSQVPVQNLLEIRDTLLESYLDGKREYSLNYWGENVSGQRVFYKQVFLLTKTENGDMRALSILKDNTAEREMDDQYIKSELENYAYKDPITNGYNYIKFKERLQEINLPGSIICLDIHSFKIINSICGITKGDEVIRGIWHGILMAIEVHKYDLAAHINADHFIIFIPSVDESEIIKKLKDITVTLMVVTLDMDVPQLQPYFGVSKWAPGKKIEMSYNEAVTAKHNAKYQQDIDYAFFSEEDTNRLIREKAIIDSFDKALAKKEFKVWFQPKYTPQTKKLVGAEALVRWVKEDGKIIKPDEFIPILESNNMIRKLDEYIFRNVCMLQKKWLEDKKNVVPVSVNLSRASLFYKGVIEQYLRIANLVGIDIKFIPIEITESAAITNESVKDVIDQFHEKGFSLQMDDFGTGYSSLASLNLMHFDTLKIDKSLVDFIGEFGGNRLIEHTISLAKELGIQITAEGVETEAQVKFLKNIGCDNIQGFFYSKPVPSIEYEKLIDKAIYEDKSLANDLVEDHLFSFNKNYYKPALYSIVVNLTQNKATDYSEYADWCYETKIDTTDYDYGLDIFIDTYLLPEEKEKFRDFMDRKKILEMYSDSKETRIIEYKRKLKDRIADMRIVFHSFKVEDSEDLWGYIKVFQHEWNLLK